MIIGRGAWRAAITSSPASIVSGSSWTGLNKVAGAAEVNGRDAAQLVVQRQVEELRQEEERLLAASMRLHGQPDREG